MAELWTPPGADLGYNMGGGGEAPPAPPETPPGQPGPAQPGGYWNAAAKDVAQGFMKKYPAPDWMTNPDMTMAERQWGATKWAFRGTRTTNVNSLAREQNMYGQVERTRIPTSRIKVQGMGQPQSTSRAILNEEELYPPPNPAEAYMANDRMLSQRHMEMGGPPMPMRMGMEPPPPNTPMPQPGSMQVTTPTAMGHSTDPLFARNTGQVPFNAAQFGDYHQRTVAGT